MSARQNGDVSHAADEIPDSVLAKRVQEGDRFAFEHLVSRYMRSVFAVTSSVLGQRDDAEDAVQDTFLRVLERIQLYDPKRPFAPWLYQVARNVARNRWRKIRRTKEERVEDIETSPDELDGDRPDDNTELSELRQRVNRAIDKLPERQRTAFRLHDIEGYTTPEIADLLGVKEGTVRANLHHARKMLGKQLKPFAREWI